MPCARAEQRFEIAILPFTKRFNVFYLFSSDLVRADCYRKQPAKLVFVLPSKICILLALTWFPCSWDNVVWFLRCPWTTMFVHFLNRVHEIFVLHQSLRYGLDFKFYRRHCCLLCHHSSSSPNHMLKLTQQGTIRHIFFPIKRVSISVFFIVSALVYCSCVFRCGDVASLEASPDFFVFNLSAANGRLRAYMLFSQLKVLVEKDYLHLLRSLRFMDLSMT